MKKSYKLKIYWPKNGAPNIMASTVELEVGKLKPLFVFEKIIITKYNFSKKNIVIIKGIF